MGGGGRKGRAFRDDDSRGGGEGVLGRATIISVCGAVLIGEYGSLKKGLRGRLAPRKSRSALEHCEGHTILVTTEVEGLMEVLFNTSASL